MHDRGDFKVWDGMTVWFLEQMSKDPNAPKTPYLQKWYNAAKSAMAKKGWHPEVR